MKKFPAMNNRRSFSVISVFMSFVIIWAFFAFLSDMYAQDADDFFSKLDKVQIDIEKILDVSNDELSLRLIMHPEQNRIDVPLHGRKRFIALTPDDDHKIAAEMVRQLVELDAFYHSEQDERRVRDIATKITSVLPQKIDPVFYLADTDVVNAFCLFDGTLVVTRGILKEFEDRELAFVIAHEYGHASARHSAEKYTKSIATEKFGSILKYSTDSKKDEDVPESQWKDLLLDGGYLLVANYGIRLPYSRTMEREADALGIVYMKKAGYDPAGAVEAMKHLQSLDGKEEPKWLTFLSTHPATSERCTRLETYAKYDSGRILTEAADDDTPMTALDWAFDGVKMLDELNFETRKCENANAKGEILFIPGIFMGKPEEYSVKLAELFPEYDITVLQWEAISKLSWKRAKYRGGMLSIYLVSYLAAKDKKDLSNMVLAGHSLGCQVILGAVKGLSSKKIKLKQVVLMGSAAPYSAEELKNCHEIASEPTWLLFKPSDRYLKYAYYFEEKAPALGLMGAKERISGIQEYRIPGVDGDETASDKLNSHYADAYFDGLEKIMKSEIKQETIKIDHAAIASPKQTFTTIPETRGTVLDTFFDWQLLSYSIGVRLYVIRNPFGEVCEFGRDKDKVTSAFEDIKRKLEKAVSQ